MNTSGFFSFNYFTQYTRSVRYQGMISYAIISAPKTDIFYIWSHEATIFSAIIRNAYILQLQLIFIFPVDSTTYKSVTSSSIFDKVRLILQRCLRTHTFLMSRTVNVWEKKFSRSYAKEFYRFMKQRIAEDSRNNSSKTFLNQWESIAFCKLRRIFFQFLIILPFSFQVVFSFLL